MDYLNMAFINNLFSDRISEEAHSDGFSFANDASDISIASDIDLLLNDLQLPDLVVAGVCTFEALNESITSSFEPHEFDKYLGPANSQNLSFDHDNNRALMDDSFLRIVEKEKKVKTNTKQIPLSQSVNIGLPQKLIPTSHEIYIVHPLEESFRPRYKSDYFAQNGKNRKPRYVADRIGNHFVTVKVPLGVCGKIRVDWLTIPTKSGDRFLMPYRFQQSNEFSNVPDLNPIYINIKADSFGIMKLYLVLIKSKQDELKLLQPLQPFRPFQDALGIPDKTNTVQMFPLMPKQLIQKYQLDKSQLAFTFCALGADGQSCIPEWNTTVYSTTLTEIAPENSKQKTIACPNCSQSFQITIGGGDDDDNSQGTMTNKRKANQYVNEKSTQLIKKQRSFPDNFITIN